jgi:4-alpha-glucanotransferase
MDTTEVSLMRKDQNVELHRSAGILLHPTSLPSGKLDRDAYRFVNWLAAAGQSWWQVLPLGPPDEFGSPYRSRSAFAASSQLLARPGARVTAGEMEDFVARHPFWTGGWARFAGSGALTDQVRFEREWGALRKYAAELGVRLMGDLPIYVADGGADLDCWPELFARGEVAGAPPDSLSATGQRWGNPLYDWPVHRATGFRWWRERFRRTFELVDLCRIDHFRGFVSYWAIPERNSTAKRGRWRPGPGAELFRAVERELGGLPLVAEDLGHITPAVHRLRDELGLPGMVVLLWAFRRARGNPHALGNHRRNSVAYTSTHDTDTAAGWFAGLRPRERAATGLDPHEPSWGLIELAYSSRAAVSIVPVQDVLGLGSEARMNRPGRTVGNWRWQLERGALTPALARRLRRLAEQYGRT